MAIPPSTTLPVGPGKFSGNENLKVNGNVIEYFGNRYHVNITDENGVSTRLTDPRKLKQIMRMLAQADFHTKKQDLLETTISDSKIKVSNKPVNVFNADKVNRLFTKFFGNLNPPKSKKEEVQIQFRKETTAPPVDPALIPPPPKKDPPPVPGAVTGTATRPPEQKEPMAPKKDPDPLVILRNVSDYLDRVAQELAKGSLTQKDETDLKGNFARIQLGLLQQIQKLPNNPADDTVESSNLRKALGEVNQKFIPINAQLQNLLNQPKKPPDDKTAAAPKP